MSASQGAAPYQSLLDRKIGLVRGHFLFTDLDPELLRRLAETARIERLAEDAYLFRKGDDGDALFGMASGKIAITTESPKHKTIVLNIMEAGDFFGEIAFLDGLERTADARALEPCEVLRIARRDFFPVLDTSPALARHLIELLCERVRWTAEAIEDAWFLDPSARIAKTFIRLAMGYGTYKGDAIYIDLSLTQTRVAQMTATSRERVNRELRKWEAADWVAREDTHYIIKNINALKSVVKTAMEDEDLL